MTDPAMSPAQKVLAAFNDRHELCGPFDDNWQELCLAAAIREAAYEVVPDNGVASSIERIVEKRIRAAFLAIAAELENPQP